MKIVIDIPEELYKHIKNDNVYYLEDGEVLYSIVKNCVVLPKGHGRLIDADTLADGFEDNFEFCEALNATPTLVEADKQ